MNQKTVGGYKNDDPQNDPQRVGIPTGKLFESQMLGDLNDRRILESIGEVLEEVIQKHGIDGPTLEIATKMIVFQSGIKKDQQKYKSFSVFMQNFMSNMKDRSDQGQRAIAYFDFSNLLTNINRVKKGKSRVPNFIDRGEFKIENNISLEIARRSNPEVPMTDFSRKVLGAIKERFPGRSFSVINGLGTPMDHVQKIDFVVAVLGENKEVLRYYAFDLKTDPTVTSSLMSEVEIIMPDDLNASLKERTESCVDKVVQSVVERESRVINKGETLERV